MLTETSGGSADTNARLYLLKVRCRGTKDLDRLLARELKDRIGVAKTRTTIVLSTAKETVRVPLADS
jgi:Lrp/AsnC family leucine-responsive transcriptional regulator